MIRPLVDLYANKDAFTGAPIESAGMERLSKQERVTDNTSPIAQALGGLSSIFGEKVSLSPVQVDYAIKAYFGWLGGTATQASVYATIPFRDGAYPDIKVMDKVSQGFLKSLPSDQSRYVTTFYENNKEINQAYADMRHYAELGETDKVKKILEDKGDKVLLNKMYDKNGKVVPLDEAKKKEITKRIITDTFAVKAYRTLLIAHADYSWDEYLRLKDANNGFGSEGDREVLEQNLTLIGIYAI
jgi:hypothetical protein